MSDFRAIYGVGTTLRTLLQDRMEEMGGTFPSPVPVTLVPPDVTPGDVTGARLNLFLYRVTENPHLENQPIPGTDHPARPGLPPLSLDLHYLMTAYGTSDEDDPGSHQLLGNAMRVLHDVRIITENLTRRRAPVGDPILDPNLHGEFEKVKICLDPISLEDLSKVWTSFTIPYRLSVAYVVSVVQIESRKPRHFPRLVGEAPDAGPRLHVVPFRSPYIREVRVIRSGDARERERPQPYARIITPPPGGQPDRLIVLGHNFAGEATRVLLGSEDVTDHAVIRDARIDVAIPDIPRLQPGLLGVRVLKDIIARTPPEPPTSFSSNLGGFMLVPHVEAIRADLGVSPRTLTVTGTRLFDPDGDNLTLVGDEAIRSTDYTTAMSTEIVLNLPDTLGSGAYAVRVRVNEAESLETPMLTIP